MATLDGGHDRSTPRRQPDRAQDQPGDPQQHNELDPIERHETEIARLCDLLEAQQAEITYLRNRLDAAAVVPARAPVAAPSTGAPSEPALASPASEPALDRLTDRRRVLRDAGAATAGALAGGAALALASSSPAAAVNGEAVTCGQIKTATATTELRYLGPSLSVNSALVVRDNNVTGTYLNAAVHGDATGPADYGVVGRTSTVGGAGVVGWGQGAGVGVVAIGTHANLWLDTAGVAPQARSEAYGDGELIADANADLWLCVGAGTPGTWRKLAGPATSGSLHVLTNTTRVYDSRAGQVPLGGIKGKFNSSEQRLIDTKLNGSGVPVGATAVLVNLTATNTNSGGFFAAFANGLAWTGNSSVNWSFLNSTVANLAVVKVDNVARFVLRCESGGQPGADAVVDVIGYYR